MRLDTPTLQIACDIQGPPAGPVVLLLHGWPYSAGSWDTVANELAGRGFRTIVPSLRGFGATRFREADAVRSAEMTAIASDAMELLDALQVNRTILVGHDWGARAGYIMAALWPRRVSRLVALSTAYETGIPSGSTLNYVQQHALWYQWLFASERGREALTDNRRGLCRSLWNMWSPTWPFDDATFESAAAAWDNREWVDITLHSYRVRWGNAPVNRKYADLEKKMKARPTIRVPTVHLHGESDGVSLASELPDQSADFTGGYRREFLPLAGHCLPMERPQEVIEAIVGTRVA